MSEATAMTEAVYYILLSLCSARHGYGIMRETERMSGGRVRLAAGTLYGAISNLCAKGYIQAVPGEADSRRKEYIITTLGRQRLENELERLNELADNGKNVLGENDNG